MKISLLLSRIILLPTCCLCRNMSLVKCDVNMSCDFQIFLKMSVIFGRLPCYAWAASIRYGIIILPHVFNVPPIFIASQPVSRQSVQNSFHFTRTLYKLYIAVTTNNNLCNKSNLSLGPHLLKLLYATNLIPAFLLDVSP